MMGSRLTALLKLYSPSVIVITKERWDQSTTSSPIRSLTEEVTRLADLNDIPIRVLRQTEVRQLFLGMQSETRHEIAASLARIFPELTSRLPPERRPWDSEHSVMTVFDAIALGLAYWSQESECIFAPDHPMDIG